MWRERLSITHPFILNGSEVRWGWGPCRSETPQKQPSCGTPVSRSPSPPLSLHHLFFLPETMTITPIAYEVHISKASSIQRPSPKNPRTTLFYLFFDKPLVKFPTSDMGGWRRTRGRSSEGPTLSDLQLLSWLTPGL